MSKRGQIKTINIIAKNPYGETVYVESICYDPKKHRKLEDIGEHVKRRLKWPDCVICRYDKPTYQVLLVNDAVFKDGRINWLLQVWEIDIEHAFGLASNNIAIVAECFEKAPGLGAGGLDTIVTIIEFLKILGFLFFVIYYFFSPYKLLLKRYKVNEFFVKDTIKMRTEWNKGFISNENFRYKNVIEHSIMKKLGYKMIDKKWINTMISRYKLPDEIVKGG